MPISPRSRMPATAMHSLSTSAWHSRPPSSPTSSTASTTPRSTSPQSREAALRLSDLEYQRITTMTTITHTTQNPLVRALHNSGLLAEDLDYHVVRASMVIMFF